MSTGRFFVLLAVLAVVAVLDTACTQSSNSSPTPIPPADPLDDWIVLERIDEFTDERSVDLTRIDSDGDFGSYGTPSLIIRCKPRDLDVVIYWGGKHVSGGGSTGELFDSLTRWDDESPIEEPVAWNESTNREGTFYALPLLFASKALGSDQVLIRLWAYGDDESYDAKFDLRGLKGHLEANADICPATGPLAELEDLR